MLETSRSAFLPNAVRLVAALVVLVALPGVSLGEAPSRLGTDVVPIFQSVHLEMNPDEEGYRGSTRIALKVTARTDTFLFHAENTTIEALRLTGPKGDVPLKHRPLGGTRGMVRVNAPHVLEIEAHTLEIDFSSPFNTQTVSLYRMEHEGEGYAFTQFEADDARGAFPCWDEPAFKIPFEITVKVPESDIVVSNTPVKSEIVQGGWREVAFQRTRPLPTYLLALAAGPLESVPLPGLGVPGRVYTVKGQSHLAALAVEMTPPILQALETWFQGKYPYEKLDFIAIPEYWPGAMEHPGAITYADGVLLQDKATATVGSKRTMARIIAHELAHQWFGNVVTMEWWDDLWLNESFADWMGDKIAHQIFPEYGMDISTIQAGLNMMNADARPSTSAIRQPVETTENLLQDVGIAYNKGKAVLASFENWLGPDVFRRGVLDYIKANRWGNATAQDLWASLDRAADQKVSRSLASWVDQPGFPLVTVEPLPDGKVRISQRRFRNLSAEVKDQTWEIPVSLRFPGNSGMVGRSFLLKGSSQVFDLGIKTTPAWIYPKAGGIGFFRWNAPEGALGRMAGEATGWLTPAERVEFIGNARGLMNAGSLGGGEFLEVLAGFADDDEPMVLRSMLGELGGIKLPFISDELMEPFAAYVRRTLRPALERVGLEPFSGEDETITLVRPQILDWLGDEGNDPEVRAYAAKKARGYLADPSSVDPSLAGVFLRLAARDGDEKLFEAYRTRFETAETPRDRQLFLGALSGFRGALQEKALRYAVEGPLRPNELFNIPGGLGSSAAGRDRLYLWMMENYDLFAKRLPPEFMAFMPFAASGCSEERIQQARTFFVGERGGPGTLKQLERIADQVKDCVTLRAREGQSVATFIQKEGVVSSATRTP